MALKAKGSGKRPGFQFSTPRLSDADIGFLDGYLDPYDELPDGAWQGACEAAIARCDRFKGRDPYEVWLAWATGNAMG